MAQASFDALLPRRRTPFSEYRVVARETVVHTLAGTGLLPGAVRRTLLRWAGVHTASAPGVGLRVAGRWSQLEIGEDVWMNRDVYIEAVGPVTIGSGTSIGMQAMIVTSHHAIEAAGWSPNPEGRAVTIGQRVWIGARAVILPGAVVEDDTIIAAGAVVTGRCRSFGVYAGVPARRIRELRSTPSAQPADPGTVPA